MVLEQFLECDWVERRKIYVFFLGFVYVLISYFVGILFFGSAISIAMLFLLTLLLVPSLIKLLKLEEKIESKQGLKHFFHNHKDIFEVYLSLFLGIFLGYILIGFFTDTNTVFSYQMDFLEKQEGLGNALITNFLEEEFVPQIDNFLGLMSVNLGVMIICFFLSLAYGAGAIFLIVLNASIFSTFLVYVINYIGRSLAQTLSVLGIFLIHLLPEISGFLLAAIAGGVLSRAFYSEKFLSKGFKNVLKDATVMLVIAIFLIILGAFLETYVTTRLVFAVL